MKGGRKAVGCRVLAALAGVCFIVTALGLAGHVSWGVGWVINAIGWLILAAVVIPLCEQVRRGKK